MKCNSFLLSMKSGVLSTNFIVSIIIGTILLIQPIFVSLCISVIYSDKLDYCSIFSIASLNSAYGMFAPFLAALPYSTRYSNEINSNYTTFIYMRMNKGYYLLERILCNTIVGGLATSIPVAILISISILVGKPYILGDIPVGFSTVYKDTIFENIQFISGGLLVSFINLGLSFLFGAVWSNIALCTSSFIQNKYAILASPMILYYGSSVILYGVDCVQYSPMNMLLPLATNSLSVPFIILYEFMIILIATAIFYTHTKRSEKNV